MAEIPGIPVIRSKVCVSQEVATIDYTIPLDKSFKGKILSIGISCVLLHDSGIISYWALAHPKETPYFHDNRTFTVEMEYELFSSSNRKR